MSLRDMVPSRRDVHWPDEVPTGETDEDGNAVMVPGPVVCSVQGLSLVHLVALMEEHEEHVKQVFGGDLNFVHLIARAPEFVAAMIAVGAGEDDLEMRTHIQTMELGFQLKCLSVIWELTAVSTDDLGNVAAAILRSMGKMAANLTETVQPEAQLSDGTTSNDSVSGRVADLQARGLLPTATPEESKGGRIAGL